MFSHCEDLENSPSFAEVRIRRAVGEVCNTNTSRVDPPVLEGQEQSKAKSAKCCNRQLQITEPLAGKV